MVEQNLNLVNTSNDEKLLALFSHLSIFFGGIIIPIIFWVTNKDKSKFVTFHALQALFFHIVYIIFIMIWVVLILIGSFGFSFIFAKNMQHSAGTPIFFIIFTVILYGLLILLILGFIAYSVYMAIKSYKGELCKYPVLGNIIYKKVYGVS